MRRNRRQGWRCACVGLVLAAGVLAGAPARAASPGSLPAGAEQRLSLDLKGVDIVDVLKLLAERSGLSFVAGPNVSGQVTLFASDVSAWEAFEMIVAANDLAYERDGRRVTVMSGRDYELAYGAPFQVRTERVIVPLRHAKATQAATVLSQLKSSVGLVVADDASNTVVLADVPPRLRELQELARRLDRPTETKVYTLRYGQVEGLKDQLHDALSPAGVFHADARTNSLMITDVPEALARVDRMLEAFDQPTGQVLIDARILQVDLTDATHLGIDWQQVFSGIHTETRANFRVLGDIVDGTTTGAALRFLSAPDGDTNLVVEALKQVGDTRTLSNPRILVADGQEARILVGTKQAFVTVTTTVPASGSVVSSPEIQFVDVGTKLFVAPDIKPDGLIGLKIRPEVSTADVEVFDSNRIPIVTTTEAETTVLVKSGVTVIIGGLISDRKEHDEKRLPILGDLPVLGAVFRGTSREITKSELVVFLTPQVVGPDGVSPALPAT